MNIYSVKTTNKFSVEYQKKKKKNYDYVMDVIVFVSKYIPNIFFWSYPFFINNNMLFSFKKINLQHFFKFKYIIRIFFYIKKKNLLISSHISNINSQHTILYL